MGLPSWFFHDNGLVSVNKALVDSRFIILLYYLILVMQRWGEWVNWVIVIRAGFQ